MSVIVNLQMGAGDSKYAVVLTPYLQVCDVKHTQWTFWPLTSAEHYFGE